MENSTYKKRPTKRMLLVFSALGLLLLWFFSSQFAGLPKGTKPQIPGQMTTVTGQQVDGLAFAGKPLVINFWATWCPPCLVELPGFVKASHAFADRVSFIGFVVDSPMNEVLGFQKKFQIPYPIIRAPIEMVAAWKADQLPMTYILNAAGEIAWSHRGFASEAELVSGIESVLAESI